MLSADYSVHHIRIKHAILFQIMRDRILRKQRSGDFHFGANPFTFAIGHIRRMFARAARSELRSEGCALNLFVWGNGAPGFVTNRAADIDFQSDR